MVKIDEQIIRSARHTSDFIISHADDILSILAGIGVIATGVLSYNAGKNIETQKQALDEQDLSTAKKRHYILKVVAAPTITAGATICCIAGSRAISRKRQAGIIAASAALAESFQAYRESVHATVGREVEECVEQNATVIHSDTNVIEDTGTGDIIFTEDFTGRKFKASIESVTTGINDFVDMYRFYGYAKLNDLYKFLKIQPTTAGNNLGWSYVDNWYFDNHDFIDFDTAMESLQIVVDDYPGLGPMIKYQTIPEYVSF